MTKKNIYSHTIKDEFDLANTVPLISESKLMSEDLSKIKASLDTLPKRIKNEVIRKIKIINFVEKHLDGGWTEKNIKPLLKRVPQELGLIAPKWRALVNWKTKYFESGRWIYSLTPKHDKKGNRNTQTDSQEIIDEAIEKKYLTRERLSISEVYRYYKSKVILENKNRAVKLKLLSEGAFRYRIAGLSPYDVAVGRFGKRYADREFRSVGEMIPATYPMEYVEIDHTPLPVILTDEKVEIALGRPYLTMLYDRYTKCIVGLSVNFREPAYDSVRKALINTMLNKSWINDEYPEIKNLWPCEGKIDNLVVDNGAEFWSKDLEDALKPFVTDIQYSPAAKPWRKTGIEKFFDQLNKGLIDNLKGKTFTNITHLKDYDPKKEAAISVSEFLSLLYKWIIDYYHMTPDSKERHIPYYAWQSSKFHPKTYQEEDELQLRIELGIVKHRSLGIAGIKLHNLRYQSKELIDFRKYYQKNSNNKPYLKTKTDPSDISFIYVWLPDRNEYIKVQTVSEEIKKLKISLFQLQVIKRVIRLNTRNKIDAEAIAETFLYLHDRIDNAANNFKHSTKNSVKTKNASKLAKYKGLGSEGPTSIAEDTQSDIKSPNKDESSSKVNKCDFNDDTDFSQIGGYKNANE